MPEISSGIVRDALSIIPDKIQHLFNCSLKMGYHTESRCQYQPASFSSAFKLSGTACLVGVGVRGGGSLLRFGTCNERGHYLSPPSSSSCCVIISHLYRES